MFCYLTYRKKCHSRTPKPQTNQLAFDGPYDATVGAGQSTFADNNQENVSDGTDRPPTHANAAFQPDTVPSEETGIYHDINDATNEHAYATVHPHVPVQEDKEDAAGELHEDTCAQGVGDANGDDKLKSEEGWVENDIYTSN